MLSNISKNDLILNKKVVKLIFGFFCRIYRLLYMDSGYFWLVVFLV